MPFSRCADTALRIAHRGLHGPGRAENSLAAFVAAAEAGLAIECDVRLAACGTVVVHHDARLADGRALGAVRAAEAGCPTLAQALGAIGGRSPVFVEAKIAGDPAPLARALAASLGGYRGAAAVMSFHPRFAAAFRRAGGRCPAGLVARALPARGLAGQDFLALEAGHAAALGPARLARALERRPLLVWTVRRLALARRLRFADGIIAEGAAIAAARPCS